MVKVGFIVEGDTEKILIDSSSFRHWATDNGIEILKPVIDAKGGGNLLPQNIEPLVMQLQAQQPEHIIILTDLEYEQSPELVRQRIGNNHTNLIFVAVKAIEAWFLADSQALQTWLDNGEFHEPNPEATPDMPWERLKEIARLLGKRGPGSSKPAFAKRMVKHYEFSIARAASHPNCPSAQEFHDGLTTLVNQ